MWKPIALAQQGEYQNYELKDTNGRVKEYSVEHAEGRNLGYRISLLLGIHRGRTRQLGGFTRTNQ